LIFIHCNPLKLKALKFDFCAFCAFLRPYQISLSILILQRIVAGGPAICVYFPQWWFLARTSGLTIAAAGMEAAAPGRIERAWNVAVQDNPPTPFFAIGNRDGRNLGLGIRMQGLQKEFAATSQFDNFAQVHDGHAVADVTNNAQIMGYE
jgi:hypothetical protein